MDLTALKADLIKSATAPVIAAIAAVMDPLIAAAPPPPDPGPAGPGDGDPPADPGPANPPSGGTPTDPSPPNPPAPPIVGGTAVFDAAELIAALKAGKPVVALKPGDYGTVAFNSLPGQARILSERPGAAVFRKITGSKTGWLTFEDVGLTGLDVDVPVKSAESIVRFEPSCPDISFLRPVVRGATDADQCWDWDVAKWKSRKRIAIWLRGDDSSVEDGDFFGIPYHAIMLDGAASVARGNAVQFFAGDAIRVLGDRDVVRKNKARNRVRPINPGEEKTDTHADFIQSWARKNAAGVLDPVDGLVIEDNLGIEWDAPEHPLAGYMQGIGFFDGPFTNLTLRRNVVWTTANHGICVSNCDGVDAEDNLVGHLYRSAAKKAPWIRFDGAQNVRLKGNVAADLLINKASQAGSFRQIAYATDQRPDFAAWPTA